ncbi:hypothetical protein SARC_12515, partial [Sphaeroforma arctica JP610]
HGPYSWVVRRRVKELHALNDHLVTQFKNTAQELPKFVNRLRLQLEGFRHTDEAKGRLAEEYLKKLLDVPATRFIPAVLNFLAVSRYSFIRELGSKYTEGFVAKKGGGHRFRLGAMQCCRFLTNNRRWCIIKDTCVLLITNVDDIRTVLLFDSSFKIRFGEDNAGKLEVYFLRSETS